MVVAIAATFTVALLVEVMFRYPPALMVAPFATLAETLPMTLPTTTEAPNGAAPPSAPASTGSAAVSDPVAVMRTLPLAVILA